MNIHTASGGSRFGDGALGRFVCGIVAVGGALLVHSAIVTASTPEPLVWLFFAGLALLTGFSSRVWAVRRLP